MICGHRLAGSNHVCGADRRAIDVNTMRVTTMRMTDMGPGGDRSELNGDQQDRHPKEPQECAGQRHP
jgi:hypothetical protein